MKSLFLCTVEAVQKDEAGDWTHQEHPSNIYTRCYMPIIFF